jgi:hypothetical protein
VVTVRQRCGCGGEGLSEARASVGTSIASSYHQLKCSSIAPFAPSAILSPNRPEDPEYIVRRLGQVITVSLETVKAVKGLPTLET